MPPPTQSRALRNVALALLYVSQAVPLGFFIVALPAILRSEGVGLERIGLVGALALPWLLKFAWAPLVDRHGLDRAHYRSWLVPLQLGCVAAVAGLATLDVGRDLTLLIVLGGAFMILSATQDIATDGLAVRILPPAERGLGNAIQVGGYYLGQILGGGVALVLHARFGWSIALFALAAVLALPLPFVLLLREPVDTAAVQISRRMVGLGTLGRFLRRSAVGPWLAILLLWRGAETAAQWMFNPLLVDRGFDLDEIGILLGVVGSLAALGGAMVGGWLTDALGRREAMLVGGTLLGVALLGYLPPALGVGGTPAIVGAVLGAAAAGGIATTALYAAMMDRCRWETSASDFTLQQSLAALGPLLAASLSGWSAATFGYAGHFAATATIQLLVVGLAAATLTADRLREEPFPAGGHG